ncbi:hypothetical protein PIB30_006982 [Stylosanthes scabra]|uniref:F-box domain-containing protein n=1 Tax=Stylosanthes scabra TaxID=79078 RepID=A0ABU6Z6B9_9FABA|nr:hypothetical protein [Stylosanthes scabra]
MEHHELYKAELPGDLIREILIRLSVRILVKLRSVCRSWNSLISSHEFAMHHHQRSTLIPSPPLLCWIQETTTDDAITHSSQSLILYHQLHPTDGLSLTSLPIEGKRIIRGSCNGFLCLSDSGFPFQTLTLFNPSTRSVSPPIPFQWPQEDETVFWGFGNDTLHEKYKFVMSCSHSSFPVTDSKVRAPVKVCTFGSNPCFKTVDLDRPVFTYKTLLGPKDGIFVSGTLNWSVYSGIISLFENLEWFVLTFNLETESFGRLSLPIRWQSDCLNNPQLQVLNGCLAVSDRHPSGEILCSVWIMKEYGVEESWTNLFQIPDYVCLTMSVPPLYISEDHVLLVLEKSCGCLANAQLIKLNFGVSSMGVKMAWDLGLRRRIIIELDSRAVLETVLNNDTGSIRHPQTLLKG